MADHTYVTSKLRTELYAHATGTALTALPALNDISRALSATGKRYGYTSDVEYLARRLMQIVAHNSTHPERQAVIALAQQAFKNALVQSRDLYADVEQSQHAALHEKQRRKQIQRTAEAHRSRERYEQTVINRFDQEVFLLYRQMLGLR